MSNSNIVQERGRLTARVSISEHERIEKGALLSGAKVSQFMVKAALEIADRIIEEERTISLTNQEIEEFYNLILDPPKPNQTLINAINNYNQGVITNESSSERRTFELKPRPY